jgi:hypothetical protein
MPKTKNKQKRTIGQRLLSSVLISLAPVVINYVVDKVAQSRANHDLAPSDEKKKIKDVTNSLK